MNEWIPLESPSQLRWWSFCLHQSDDTALVKVTNKLHRVKSSGTLTALFFFNYSLLSFCFHCYPFLPHVPHLSLPVTVRGFSPKTWSRLYQSSQNLSEASCLTQKSIQSSYLGLQGSAFFAVFPTSSTTSLITLLQTHRPPCCSFSLLRMAWHQGFAHAIFWYFLPSESTWLAPSLCSMLHCPSVTTLSEVTCLML